MLIDKYIIDKYFKDNWGLTPIHYDGANFTMPTDGKWIHVMLIPFDRQSLSTANGLKVDYALIRVNCYDKSVTKCYNLAEKVQQFLECKKIPTNDRKEILVDMGISDGQGATPLHNGIFETQLDFTARKYT